LKDISALINKGDEPLTKHNRSRLNFLVMQLRKCCNHPFQFDGAEVDIDNTTLKDLIAASGKLSVLDMLLTSLFKKGHRTVLFSQFTYMLDIIEDYCIMRGWRYCRFDGSTPRAKRNCVINQFNADGSDRFIFLMSTRSGGMGLNLQTADTCILFDSDWNPQ
jgi:SWI/SNF-related matrix-associated actin-dependent regulator of chromatin subfamily A member 5